MITLKMRIAGKPLWFFLDGQFHRNNRTLHLPADGKPYTGALCKPKTTALNVRDGGMAQDFAGTYRYNRCKACMKLLDKYGMQVVHYTEDKPPKHYYP